MHTDITHLTPRCQAISQCSTLLTIKSFTSLKYNLELLSDCTLQIFYNPNGGYERNELCQMNNFDLIQLLHQTSAIFLYPKNTFPHTKLLKVSTFLLLLLLLPLCVQAIYSTGSLVNVSRFRNVNKSN